MKFELASIFISFIITIIVFSFISKILKKEVIEERKNPVKIAIQSIRTASNSSQIEKIQEPTIVENFKPTTPNRKIVKKNLISKKKMQKKKYLRKKSKSKYL